MQLLENHWKYLLKHLNKNKDHTITPEEFVKFKLGTIMKYFPHLESPPFRLNTSVKEIKMMHEKLGAVGTEQLVLGGWSHVEILFLGKTISIKTEIIYLIEGVNY